MSNILLTRIDNRLVHGQVATQWCRNIGANLILVINDAVAGNALRQELMNMAVPAHISIRYWSIENACASIPKLPKRQKIMIVCEKPQDVWKLIEGGISIKKVNIGNMNSGDGKNKVTDSVAVGEEDLVIFRKMYESGVELELRRVPSEEAEALTKLLL